MYLSKQLCKQLDHQAHLNHRTFLGTANDTTVKPESVVHLIHGCRYYTAQYSLSSNHTIRLKKFVQFHLLLCGKCHIART